MKGNKERLWATLPGHECTPESTMQSTHKWEPERIEKLDSTYHVRKTDFSLYAEKAARNRASDAKQAAKQ